MKKAMIFVLVVFTLFFNPNTLASGPDVDEEIIWQPFLSAVEDGQGVINEGEWCLYTLSAPAYGIVIDPVTSEVVFEHAVIEAGQKIVLLKYDDSGWSENQAHVYDVSDMTPSGKKCYLFQHREEVASPWARSESVRNVWNMTFTSNLIDENFLPIGLFDLPPTPTPDPVLEVIVSISEANTEMAKEMGEKLDEVEDIVEEELEKATPTVLPPTAIPTNTPAPKTLMMIP